MKCTVLGSGVGMTHPDQPYRYPSGYLVESGDVSFLLDCGLGVLPQLYGSGKSLRRINTIFISHFHIDHFNIAPIIQALYMYIRYDGTMQTITIFGPKGIESRIRTVCSAAEFDLDKLADAANLRVQEYKSGVPIQVSESVRVIPYATRHADLDAYSLRVEATGAVLAYSGDTTDHKGVREAAHEADIFICEAAKGLSGPETTDKHVNTIGAARIARDCGTKRLVLSHYSGADSVNDMMQAAQAVYGAGVVVAEDGDSFEV